MPKIKQDKNGQTNSISQVRYGCALEYRQLAEDVSAEVEFVEDGYIVGELLKQQDYGHKPPVIFGTSWERDIVKELKGHIVEVSYLVSYDVVLNKTYIGYRGALTLLETIFTTAISKSA